MNKSDSRDDIADSKIKCDKFYESENCKNRPLELEWIFGLNSNVKILNLTNGTTNSLEKIFASATSHVIQIYCSDSNRSQCFVGHESEIIALETDSTGRFIASADCEGVINIWDRNVANEFPHPIRTIYEPYQQRHQDGRRKLTKLALSSDGKNIITACDGNGSIIKLWQWSYGAASDVDKPNDMFELPEKYEHVENLRFNNNQNEMSSSFVVTCRNGVIFGQWDGMGKKFNRHFPARAISINFRFIDTIFMENSNVALSITKCGSAVVWNSNSILMENQSNVRHDYKKEYVKSIKLCDSPLTVIKSIDDCIVVGDARGKIRFYDRELKIIFWSPSNDFVHSIDTISFDLLPKSRSVDEFIQTFYIRDFLIQTKSEIFSVDFSQMKFTRMFHKFDDFITAFDVFPLDKKLICCANYSGRIMIYDYEKKLQIIESQLKLRKRKSSTSDVDVIEMPHVSAIAYSRNGHHLVCGLQNGTIIFLDSCVLRELRSFNVLQNEIVKLKFSPDSLFVTVYDVKSNMVVMSHEIATEEEWLTVGSKVHYHTKPICDVLYIQPTPTACSNQHIKTVPRLISLAQDRQIVEYDLLESMKENSLNLVITFTKRIFQTAIPVSITLFYNSLKHEDQILIADSKMKFKIFDKNTFEILATFMGPIYDSYVKQFDANTSFGLTIYSKFFIFSTNKNVCLFAMPIDGNPYRSLGVIGHCDGVKAIKAESTKQYLFTIGNKCQALFMWNINFQPLFDHLDEGGIGLKPYCDLLPGGKYGKIFQDAQNLYYYMLMLSNGNSIDERSVKDGLEINEVPDYFRGLGYFPSDYEIECIKNELNLNGKRRVAFEELIKVFINHAAAYNGNGNSNGMNEIEKAMRSLCNYTHDDDIPSTDIFITKTNLLSILTDAAEKVETKDAEFYLENLFQGPKKLINEFSLSDFIHDVLKLNWKDFVKDIR